MLRKGLIIAAAGIAIAAGGSLTSRANAIPLGLPADTADQLNLIDIVALCFYVDGWNGPGLYECGFRYRRGFGWHGARRGGGRVVVHSGGHGGHGHVGGGRGGRGGGRHH